MFPVTNCRHRRRFDNFVIVLSRTSILHFCQMPTLGPAKFVGFANLPESQIIPFRTVRSTSHSRALFGDISNLDDAKVLKNIFVSWYPLCRKLHWYPLAISLKTKFAIFWQNVIF